MQIGSDLDGTPCFYAIKALRAIGERFVASGAPAILHFVAVGDTCSIKDINHMVNLAAAELASSPIKK